MRMHGCPFGLGSVVLTFNRFPALMVAATRRLLFVMHGAYFDDNVTVDLAGSGHHAQGLVRGMFSDMGPPLSKGSQVV